MTDIAKLERVERALAALAPLESPCRLCPRDCRVDRARGATGVCQTGRQASVSHALLHYGEEPVLSGPGYPGPSAKRARAGSGTIFFTGCNLKCLFCQNYQLSWLLEGEEASDRELAGMMLKLERQGALNINLVSPSHVLPPILRALKIALEQGLSLPIVYNSNGYEKADIILLLEGIVDIYLPDLKYHDAKVSGRYSGAADYFQHAGPAIGEMFRQQPRLVLDDREIAVRGLMIRHLVLPGQVRDTWAVLEWIRYNLSPSVYLSLMSQYRPCFRAPEELRRGLTAKEYQEAVLRAEELGFESLYTQPKLFRDGEHIIPDFERRKPFRWGRGGRKRGQ
jgi:putative pyruvate formate lyase activating enzyme